jgi:hypothetical protein
VALPFTLKKYLKAKEELWKLQNQAIKRPTTCCTMVVLQLVGPGLQLTSVLLSPQHEFHLMIPKNCFSITSHHNLMIPKNLFHYYFSPQFDDTQELFHYYFAPQFDDTQELFHYYFSPQLLLQTAHPCNKAFLVHWKMVIKIWGLELCVVGFSVSPCIYGLFEHTSMVLLVYRTYF